MERLTLDDGSSEGHVPHRASKAQDDESDLLVQSKVNNDLGYGGHLALVVETCA